MAKVGEVTVENILRAIAARLEGALAGARVVTLEEMLEGIPDTPMVLVYWESVEPILPTSNNGRGGGGMQQTTIRGGVQVIELVVHVDVYARQRSHIGEDMLRQVEICDRIIDVLQQETSTPFFGQAGLHGFMWRGERVTFEQGSGEAPIKFAGNRFVLTFRIF